MKRRRGSLMFDTIISVLIIGIIIVAGIILFMLALTILNRLLAWVPENFSWIKLVILIPLGIYLLWSSVDDIRIAQHDSTNVVVGGIAVIFFGLILIGKISKGEE